jgi:bifunctional DNA-binding transcriptional regulator/antitoxin component of YhaV-PrlF toxin-antitoxin module
MRRAGSVRGLLQALGWGPGHRVDLAVAGDAVVIGGSVTGRQTVGSRGELAVPAAARSLTGLDGDARVVLVAAVGQDILVVHPQAAVVRLLAGHYAQQASEDQR